LAGEICRSYREAARGEKISWVSTDVECVVAEEGGRRERCAANESTDFHRASAAIGRIGLAALVEGRCTDALALDANYVRRSDAEISGREAQRMVAETEGEPVAGRFVCLAKRTRQRHRRF